MARLDSLLRDSRGKNQGMGRSVFQMEALGDNMLPSAPRLLAESDSCICRTGVIISLLVFPWNLPLAPRGLSLVLARGLLLLRASDTMLNPSHAWNTSLSSPLPFLLVPHQSKVFVLKLIVLDWVQAYNTGL